MAAGSSLAAANPETAAIGAAGNAIGAALGGANSSGPSTAKSNSEVNVGGLNVPAYPFPYMAGELPQQQQQAMASAGGGVSNSTVMLGMLGLAALVLFHV